MRCNRNNLGQRLIGEPEGYLTSLSFSITEVASYSVTLKNHIPRFPRLSRPILPVPNRSRNRGYRSVNKCWQVFVGAGFLQVATGRVKGPEARSVPAPTGQVPEIPRQWLRANGK
jgi:hypothetical protein